MRKASSRRKFFRSLEAKSLRSRSFLTQIADKLTTICSSPMFFLINALSFFFWITINLGLVPGIPVIDPFPFGLLTMVVSLEAIFLSIFVLISQNRSAYISTLRDEIELSVNLTAEAEITKILEILAEMRKKMGITTADPELEQMMQDINKNQIEQSITEQIERANKGIREQMRLEFPDIIPDAVTGLIKKPVEFLTTNGDDKKPAAGTKSKA